MQSPDREITLYSSSISDASARVRIALGLKQLQYQKILVRLSKRMNEAEEFSSINQARTVPLLIIKDPSKAESENLTILTQSIAILEYLDEAYPQTTALLPPSDQPLARAKVRSLVGMIATDVHPLTTHRMRREIYRQFPGSETTTAEGNNNRDWDTYWITRGLHIYETLAAETAGLYSFGDTISMADVYLIPQLWTGMKKGVKLETFPVISKVYENLMKVEAIKDEEHNPQLEDVEEVH